MALENHDHLNDPMRLYIIDDNASKTETTLATLNMLRAAAINLQQYIDHCVVADLPEVNQATGAAPQNYVDYQLHSTPIATFRQAQTKLMRMLLDALQQMKQDEMNAKHVLLGDDDDDSRVQGLTIKKQPPSGDNGVEAAPKFSKLGPTATNTEEDSESLTRTESSSADELDAFNPLQRTGKLKSRPRFVGQSDEVEKYQKRTASSRPNFADFDPFTATASECRARYEAWMSLHPGLRAGAQQTHSREARRRNRAKNQHRENEALYRIPTMMSASERGYDASNSVITEAGNTASTRAEASTRRASRQALSDRLKQQAKELHQDIVESEKQRQGLPMRTKSKQQAVRYSEALPQRLVEGKGKRRDCGHTPTLDPPFSFSESRAFYGRRRGGAIAPSGLEPDPNDDPDDASSFAAALADLNVKDSGALPGNEWDPAERVSYLLPRSSGHAYAPGGMAERARVRGRESIDRTDQELFAEGAAWHRGEAVKGRGRSGLAHDMRYRR